MWPAYKPRGTNHLTKGESMKTSTVARVTYRWDDQSGVEPGWYCQSYDAEGECLADSQKIWWPIEVDDYETAEDLAAALAEAFPGAEIEDETHHP